jgi:hypothetical protein
MKHEEVVNLSAKIEAAIMIDTDAGIIKEKEPGKVYEQNLPDGLTLDLVEKINNYDTVFVAAGAHAYGNMAIKAMAENKGLKQVTGELKTIDKNKASYSVERSKEYVNHLQGGEKTTKYGVTTTSYEIKAGKNSGQLKTVKNELAELALKMLK